MDNEELEMLIISGGVARNVRQRIIESSDIKSLNHSQLLSVGQIAVEGGIGVHYNYFLD